MPSASPQRLDTPHSALALGAAAPRHWQVPRDTALEAARQDYLDALPIAGAVICANGIDDIWIDKANDPFRRLALLGTGPIDLPIGEAAFLSASRIGERLIRFFADEADDMQFEGGDGKDVGGRYFSIRIARLAATNYATDRCLLSIVDRTAQVDTENSLRAEMLRDSLTGLPNRLAFAEQVELLLQDTGLSDSSHAVLVVDLARFSRVNECVGAIAGDELLIAFASRLFSALSPGDVLARIGSDEFGILLRLETGLEDALATAARIKAALVAPFRLSELEIQVDCSIGCALVNGKVDFAEEVVRNAQFAVKRAKNNNEIHVYEANEAQAARRLFSLETELRRAIENGQLTMAFQPLVDLQSGHVAGFEALTRWEQEEGGAVDASKFIAVAEESGLIVPLGRWALEEATRILAEWDRESGGALPLYMGVNVSPVQIARDDVVGLLSSALDRHGLAGERLTLELTESAIVRDPERAAKVLNGVKELNARIAMDDFGTGYTSLAYLQRLPIDILKVDRSFVSHMMTDRDSFAIIRAVLSLATALGMSTTAEGIETEDLARTLGYLGCSHGQGYYYAAPMSAEDALAYALSRSASST
ncbi:EAL domain-containing protein [Allosphingosinicella flava]|uniref:EAL domain-containing protein n=1 Tax=Allosphingosinicella flava TaxID=2771430 RepID=A0A7T2LL43_9SPHN|nr:EAL domain-containing protein [Sphingosinicella flava]QPQ54024.1 EAL domain-containing protein [Sphingosinicella flava]